MLLKIPKINSHNQHNQPFYFRPQITQITQIYAPNGFSLFLFIFGRLPDDLSKLCGMVSGFWTPGTRSREGESRYPLGYIGSRSAAFFFSKSQRPSIPTTKVRNFFDMSDHEIVGGCSTLLAKSNKKMHFSRPNYIPCSRNRIKKCIFRDQGLVYIKESRLKKVRYLQKSRTKKVLK